MKNTGTKTIETDVYDHDFFMLDSVPSGPGMVVRFPFEPKAEPGFENGARIDGKEIIYERELQTGESAASSLTGFSSNVSDFDFVVENKNTGVGVEQSGDIPISSIYFWSIRTTICPEAYIHLKIAPGQTATLDDPLSLLRQVAALTFVFPVVFRYGDLIHSRAKPVFVPILFL